MARDRPSPYGEGAAHGVIGMARDRPAPYGKGRRFFLRSAGLVTATLSDLGKTRDEIELTQNKPGEE